MHGGALMTTTRTVNSGTMNSSVYSTGIVSVGDCQELSCDINITNDLVQTITFALYRADANNALFPLYTTTLSSGQTSIDIGPCYGYTVYRAFGDAIEIQITASNNQSPFLSGTFSLKGKG